MYIHTVLQQPFVEVLTRPRQASSVSSTVLVCSPIARGTFFMNDQLLLNNPLNVIAAGDHRHALKMLSNRFDSYRCAGFFAQRALVARLSDTRQAS